MTRGREEKKERFGAGRNGSGTKMRTAGQFDMIGCSGAGPHLPDEEPPLIVGCRAVHGNLLLEKH
jgi:hypothetical protein